MPTLYKIYAAVLTERLRKEVEEKGLLPPNQTGFRREMGTIDNIYTLNFLVNRQIKKAKGKVIAFFIDLRAAFDSVDRGVLMEALRERGVREGLRKRVKELLRETRSRVRTDKGVTEPFWTARGVRQGCPLNPLLYNLLTADMEEKMSKGGGGGIKIGEKKIYTLAYADDVVLLAEEEGEMRAMMESLERYLDEKRLELNQEKSKIMRFRKEAGRWRKANWWWKGKKIEEVGQFKYLGYVFKRNGGSEAQIKDRMIKAGVVMRQVWGIGKRKFGKNWKRRIWLWDKLVWTVIAYGAEVWGWKEWKEIEGLQERYTRWTLGVDWRTPGYLLREELKRWKMRTRSGKLAWGFERKLWEGIGGELARSCWEQLIRDEGRGGEKNKWEEEREKFFQERGIEMREIENKRRSWEMEYKEIEEKDRQIQEEERWERIMESRYNKWYKMIKEPGIPRYLEKGWREERWRRMARFRLGNEIKESEYWEKEDKRKCRVCGWEEETWEHIWERCAGGKTRKEGWQEKVKELMGGGSEGEEWMKEVEEYRKGTREEGEAGK
ncbi:uncharacterized protein LOC123988066 [Osmia bicornis bicornis]|uniref:uncharacterized protein LOC123988066 n=1 Tax=Osmia bicornis bicornis TaxID=1437191 RepID=UPI001EAED1E4|nr:uncharacterized protein LOC123988066 [Osmia bicornis bicornis]